MTFEVDIEKTLHHLLKQEDTDGDKKITIEDDGPKRFKLTNTEGETYDITGTYFLSNLLQELILAKDEGLETALISLSKIEEKPVHRISRMIKDYYWDGLTRRMDAAGIEQLLADTKNETIENKKLKVFVPNSDDLAFRYYSEIQERLPIDVVKLPVDVTPEYVKSLNEDSGILALKLSEENEKIVAAPFVVPGGRFNEMYGWDSYFESIGLLKDGRTDLAIGMANNFQYQIDHYGKILNANRSYYLTRSQPPFYSSLISEIYEETQDANWLKSHLETAIKEYETVWMVSGERLTRNGLNRYLAAGIGRPPEAEAGHFHHEIAQYAKAERMEIDVYEMAYARGIIQNKELDSYFIHDRSVRESGHDTSYRLEGICAHLNPVELNAFLYKYEKDFARLIDDVFQGEVSFFGKVYTPDYWLNKAAIRKAKVDELLWNDNEGAYFDYNFITEQQSNFESATGLTPLWAGMCSPTQAAKLISNLLPKLLEKGGVVSCTRASRGSISPMRPQKQWDYPNGWAPHQMMIWKGLKDYGFDDELREVVYRWLFMITRNAVDYNGTVPEKYDVVSATHKVFAEYGNVGTEFTYITKEGFGWMNASFQYGISLIEPSMIEKLNQLASPEQLFE